MLDLGDGMAWIVKSQGNRRPTITLSNIQKFLQITYLKVNISFFVPGQKNHAYVHFKIFFETVLPSTTFKTQHFVKLEFSNVQKSTRKPNPEPRIIISIIHFNLHQHILYIVQNQKKIFISYYVIHIIFHFLNPMLKSVSHHKVLLDSVKQHNSTRIITSDFNSASATYSEWYLILQGAFRTSSDSCLNSNKTVWTQPSFFVRSLTLSYIPFTIKLALLL